MWCAHSRLSNANLELALPNLECLCPVTESDGKAGSGLNGKTLSTYRRFIRNTWPLRNVVNICDVCDQCKSLLCKHELNYLTAETYLKSPLPKVQMLQLTHPCDWWWWGVYCLWTLKGVKGCFPNAIYVKKIRFGGLLRLNVLGNFLGDTKCYHIQYPYQRLWATIEGARWSNVLIKLNITEGRILSKLVV